MIIVIEKERIQVTLVFLWVLSPSPDHKRSLFHWWILHRGNEVSDNMLNLAVKQLNSQERSDRAVRVLIDIIFSAGKSCWEMWEYFLLQSCSHPLLFDGWVVWITDKAGVCERLREMLIILDAVEQQLLPHNRLEVLWFVVLQQTI